MTGTLLNVGAILLGTAIGTSVGARLPQGLQERVLAGLALVTLIIGIENALEWDATNPLYVMGGVLIGGLIGEQLDIEGRLERLGDRLQARVAHRPGGATVSEGFVTASLLFCIGPLAVLGSLQDGLTGDIEILATKALLDGFASIALAATLGIGVGFSALSVLGFQGALTLGAGLVEPVLAEDSEALAALTSAGGMLVIGISLRLAEIKDVKVGNFLPALVVAPALVGVGSLF